MRFVYFVLLYSVAPFIGLLIFFTGFTQSTQALEMPLKNVHESTGLIEGQLLEIRGEAGSFSRTALEQERQYQEQNEMMEFFAGKSQEHKQLSDGIYEERILAMLGPPVGSHSSGRVEIKVFRLDELGYRGFIAKIKLFDPSALKVVLAGDKLGNQETTAEAVKRTGAVLGINGGGFYNAGGKALPIGNTVIDGKLVGGFTPADDVFFAGTGKDGTFIGGVFPKKEDLLKLDPWQGVSFLPVLIRQGKPASIPQEWVTTRQPRTIIGEYANGDLILIVVDGRQSDWSSGVTLERLQVKLAELGVKEGYNLDGGGSSTFIFRGEVLNRPSDGRQRPVVTNIVIMP
jgi:exopolysaccharide biosynthesis protein